MIIPSRNTNASAAVLPLCVWLISQVLLSRNNCMVWNRKLEATWKNFRKEEWEKYYWWCRPYIKEKESALWVKAKKIDEKHLWYL